MKKMIRRLTAVLTAMMFIALSAATAGAADFNSADNPVAVMPAGEVNAWEAYDQLNAYRSLYNATAVKSKKIGMLKRSGKLEAIALTRAKEMAETGQFSHTRPNGKRGVSLIKGSKAKGENIARGQTTCAEVSEAWFASPGHRKNMLRKDFKKVGIAGYTYNGVTYWVQIYSS